MKVLKSLFSPRKLLIYLCIIIFIFTVPQITHPSMSEREAIVTMLCVDSKDDKIQIAAIALAPGSGKDASYKVYLGEGSTVGEASNSIGVALGKAMGYAQCDVVAFGEEISKNSIMAPLDYLTRTRKVSGTAIIINFEGEIDKFAQGIASLYTDKKLHIEDILTYDKRFIISKECNINSFYRGYYSDIAQGMMPKLSLETESTGNAIEVQAGDSGSGGGSEGESGSGGGNLQSSGQKQYILNDGTTCIFKNGKKVYEFSPAEANKLRLFLVRSQSGIITVDNVTDSTFSNATVVLNLTKKDVQFNAKFEGDKAKFKIVIDLDVIVDEVKEDEPNDRFLKRNKEFLSEELINKIKEKTISDCFDIISTCREQKFDLMQTYETFYRYKHKQFKEFLNKYGDDYLNHIDFSVEVKVNSSY